MVVAVYPGSFDPVTLGHIDIITRASKAVDRLIVGVLINSQKQPFFQAEERVEMIQEAVKHLPNVEVVSFSGLTVEFAKSQNAKIIIRGLRAITDFEYELQLAQTNKKISPDVDTIFFTTDLKYAYLSSSIVKEVAAYGGDIHNFVPDFVEKKVFEKLK